MGIVNVKSEGSFSKTKDYLKKAKNLKHLAQLARLTAIAAEGVRELQKATPKRTGKTADSWDYTIEVTDTKTVVSWTNSNVIKYVNIAIILQYGHATRTGGYVEGTDYINPALKPIFDKMTNDMWKAVVSL